MTVTERIPTRVVVAVLAAFVLWTLLLLGLPYSASFNLVLKVALFGMPAYVLMKIAGATDPIKSLGLGRAPDARWIFLSTALLTVYLLLVSGDWTGIASISPFYVASAIIISPLVEEIAFRGVLLPLLHRVLPFGISNLATAVLFVLYHLPLWVARGQTVSFMGCLWVAAFSLWVGYVLRRSQSLWTCVIVHSIHNLLLAAA